MVDSKMSVIVPLKGPNYATWRVQLKMALIKENLWGIVNETESPPAVSLTSETAKFNARKDKALATIVLAVDTSLLYLLDDPTDPVVVWNKLSDQFQKKSWANKLELRRKLYSTKLKDGDCVQKHIKNMTEIFNELAVIGDPIKDEDRVLHLLATLSPSYDMLVTALQTNANVPPMDLVVERLLNEEFKKKGESSTIISPSSNKVENALISARKVGVRCHQCNRIGHLKKNCWHNPANKKQKFAKGNNHYAQVSNSDDCILLAISALSTGGENVRKNDWITDSGATRHMCNNIELFSSSKELNTPVTVEVGDLRKLKGTAFGNVELKLKLPHGQSKQCTLRDVLFVPELGYNLLSIPSVTQSGKTANFTQHRCEILDKYGKILCVAERRKNLYFVAMEPNQENKVNLVKSEKLSKENIWHQRFGHVCGKNLQKMANEKMVDGFNYNVNNELDFCSDCIYGKQQKKKFPIRKTNETRGVLELVHTDLCGKMNEKSFNRGEYFIIFIDDATRYTWIYILQTKDQAFEKFKIWKAEAENWTRKSLKILRSDGGGEYMSTEFTEYLQQHGIQHQTTISKTPEQNGVSERKNRYLVESTRSMLANSGLSQKFWAEAVSTAAYLQNRCCTRAIHGKTPYEAFTGKKPSVSHLRVFGCTAYSQIPKDERKKLDFKSKKSILLGYGGSKKAYRLYDMEEKKVFHSRNVIFNESEFPSRDNINNNETNLNPFAESNCHDEQNVVLDGAETDPDSSDEAEKMLRRSARIKRKPEYYGISSYLVNDELSDDHSKKWKSAMDAEIENMKKNEVWDLVQLPRDKKVIGSKWVFKKKFDENGKVTQHKARLVAQGFTQVFGQDYDEIFSPVVRFESVRTICALAVQHNFFLHQMDVNAAFLNGKLEEEIYVKQPEGYEVKGKEDYVCKLNKSLYGLKQSPRCWNAELKEFFFQIGFRQLASDQCLFTTSEGEKVILAVYVDDIILAAKSLKKLNEIKLLISKKYEVKDLGELKNFLGVKVTQDEKKIFLSQEFYIDGILDKFSMKDCKPVDNPCTPGEKLIRSTEDDEPFDKKIYQSAVGSLLYLSIKTRPDISYAVSTVAKFSDNPNQQHWKSVKRIFRYLKGTISYGLKYEGEKSGVLTGFSDADYAGDLDDRKSVSGYNFKLSGASISWRSKKQTSVSLSTAEAEYTALALAAQDAVWLRQLLEELGYLCIIPTIIYEDNQSAIAISNNVTFHDRTKHIDVKYQFVNDHVKKRSIFIEYCPTEDMIADILTKSIPTIKLCKLRSMLGVSPMS